MIHQCTKKILKCLKIAARENIVSWNELSNLKYLKTVLRVKRNIYAKDVVNTWRKWKSPQALENGLAVNPRVEELEDLCPLELMLISQIIPFMSIVPKHKGAQFSLIGQCVLVPADLKQAETSSSRPCDEHCVINLALKRQASKWQELLP